MDFDAEIEIILPCKMTGHDFLAMYKRIFVLEVSIFCFLDIKNNEVLREMERMKNGNTPLLNLIIQTNDCIKRIKIRSQLVYHL